MPCSVPMATSARPMVLDCSLGLPLTMTTRSGAVSGIAELLVDSWGDLGAQPLDGGQELLLRHAAHPHVDDDAGQAVHLPEPQDLVGDLLRVADEVASRVGGPGVEGIARQPHPAAALVVVLHQEPRDVGVHGLARLLRAAAHVATDADADRQ